MHWELDADLLGAPRRDIRAVVSMCSHTNIEGIAPGQSNPGVTGSAPSRLASLDRKLSQHNNDLSCSKSAADIVSETQVLAVSHSVSHSVAAWVICAIGISTIWMIPTSFESADLDPIVARWARSQLYRCFTIPSLCVMSLAVWCVLPVVRWLGKEL